MYCYTKLSLKLIDKNYILVIICILFYIALLTIIFRVLYSVYKDYFTNLNYIVKDHPNHISLSSNVFDVVPLFLDGNYRTFFPLCQGDLL